MRQHRTNFFKTLSSGALACWSAAHLCRFLTVAMPSAPKRTKTIIAPNAGGASVLSSRERRPIFTSPTAVPKSFVFLALLLTLIPAIPARASILHPSDYAHYATEFNTYVPETITNYISDAQSWDWMQKEIPLFDCPDSEVRELYYFRWWSFRKHLVQTPQGFVFTEFFTPVKHAGIYNTISCAASFHVDEARWLHDQTYVDNYIHFWLRGDNGQPEPKFHNYSSWLDSAIYDHYLVDHDTTFVTNLLPDLDADYHLWQQEHETNGLYWSFDVRDGMEESISGSRKNHNLRPTINSYMFANAEAISAIAELAGQKHLAKEYHHTAEDLRERIEKSLWDNDAQFFKVRLDNGKLSDAREELGYVPWMFELPDQSKKYAAAWLELTNDQGFNAPAGLTTAERRHPLFRTHGVGNCEWDGAVWPFATSQTLYGLANSLRDYKHNDLTKRDYFDVFLTYVHSQHANGKPYIGEYLDEVTGDWINGRADRSRYYNHSTFADLLITGVIGLRPRADKTVEIQPLLPEGVWDWFCLQDVQYHGFSLTIVWDQSGDHYHQGQGLTLLADGQPLAHSKSLSNLTGKLP